MELISNNSGYWHIFEHIFAYLDFQDIRNCSFVNEEWKTILSNPIFCLKKCTREKLLNQNDATKWKRAIQITKNTKFQICVTKCLQKILQFGILNMPCFIDAGSIEGVERYLQSTFWSKFNIFEIAARENEPGITQILSACSTTNPNAPNSNGWTPIHVAALHGHEEVIKVLALFSNEDPNAPNPQGWTPIQRAAYLGQAGIIKILAPRTENPNAPNPYGWTPMDLAVCHGHTEVIKALLPWCYDPNTPNLLGWTPIQWAATFGYLDVIKLLLPLCKDPHAPNPYGWSPISLADSKGYNDIVDILQEFN